MTVSTLTISKELSFPNLNAGLTYDIDTYAAFAYTITELWQMQTSSGSVTATVKINGTAVTGLSSLSINSTGPFTNYPATGANTVNVGDQVQIVFSSNSGATNIKGTLAATRTAVSSVSNSDGTLTISPTAGDVVASLAPLTSAKFLVGNGTNVATGVAMSGDATLANTGALTIAANAVTNAKAAQMAAGTIKSNLTGSTANAADNSVSAVSSAVSTGGFINKFRNGQMGVGQRGILGTIIAGSPGYTLDGFIISATGANLTWAQGNDFPAAILEFSNYVEIIGSTSNSDTTIKQRIESSIAASLSNQQVTFQCQIINSTGSTITPKLTVKHPSTADNWGSTLTTDVNAVSLQPVANGVTACLSYTFAAAGLSYNGLEVTLDVGALASNAQIVYTTGWDIRATPGVATGLNSFPPTPEVRPISTELALCQRYFNSTFGNNVTPAQNAGLSGALGAQAYGAAAGELYTQWNFPVQMRANPTMTTYNPSAANANWRDKTGSSDVVVSVDPDAAIGLAGVMIGSQTTALTAGHRCYIHATASAEL
jgi:hypothetical protein